MTQRITGTFDVKMSPLDAYDKTEPVTAGRFSLDKQYHGPLNASAKGEMLSLGTATKGSAAYVATERVTGTLDGKAGSFALVHTGVMNRGAPSLSVQVVPDSGTGALTGIAGKLDIRIENKQHFYDFTYTLP